MRICRDCQAKAISSAWEGRRKKWHSRARRPSQTTEVVRRRVERANAALRKARRLGAERESSDLRALAKNLFLRLSAGGKKLVECTIAEGKVRITYQVTEEVEL